VAMASLPLSTLLLRKKQKGSSAVMLLASTNPPTQQLVRFYCDVALLQKAMAKTDCVSQLSNGRSLPDIVREQSKTEPILFLPWKSVFG